MTPSEKALALCHAIEAAGASEQLTKCSVLASELREQLAGIESAIDPFARVYRFNAPLAPPDGAAVRSFMPGVWPTMGDLRKLSEVLE